MSAAPAEGPPTSWIGRVRTHLERELPYEKLLPETQPSYVASWIYVFGVLTVAALVMIVASGIVLAFEGRPGTTSPRSGTSSTACTSGACRCSSCSW